MPERLLASIDLGKVLYSVVALESEGNLLRPVIYGTAFCIGPGIFMTAGHVLSMIADDGGRVAVSRLDTDGVLRAATATSTEILPTCDIGLIAARAEGVALLDWAGEPRSLLSDVSAIGFPYAVTSQEDPPAFKVTMRGFKGHVITRTTMWRVPGQPVGYEISSPFPKGLSGAPLLDGTPPVPELKVLGIVLGSGEVEAFGETTRFGVALDILELQRLRSERILGGTFGDFREAVLSGDEFRFAEGVPFSRWERRKGGA